MSNQEFVISEDAKVRQVCPDGSHNAVCAAVHDLGVQKSNTVGWPSRRKVALIFEVAETFAEGPLAGQPYRLSKIVSATLSDKSTLTALLTSWFGRDPRKKVNGKTEFAPPMLVGKPCTLTVVHKTTADGDTQAIVQTVASHMKGLPVLSSTLDSSQVPDWIRRMQDERLDKVAQTQAVGSGETAKPITLEMPVVAVDAAASESPPPAAEPNRTPADSWGVV